MAIIFVCATLGGFGIVTYLLITSGNRKDAVHLGITLVATGVGFFLAMFGQTYLQQREQKREMVSQIGAAYYEMESNKRAIMELLELWQYSDIPKDIGPRMVTVGNLRILFEKDLTYTRITSPDFKWRVSEMFVQSSEMKGEFDTIKSRYTEQRIFTLVKFKDKLDFFAFTLEEEAKDIWSREWSHVKDGIVQARLRGTF